MYLLTNKTGYDIEVNPDSEFPVQLKHDQEFLISELPATKDIIVYNDGDCNVFISNGYTTLDRIHVKEIYLG